MTNVKAVVDGLQVMVPVPETLDPAAQLALAVEALSIQDKDQLAQAVDWAAQLKGAHDEAETARDFLVRPLNDHVRAINDVFKPKTNAIAAALKTLKRKIGAYHAAAERREQEAARAAAEFVGASAEVQEIVGSVTQREVARTGNATAATATRWDYEVEGADQIRALCGAIHAGQLDPSFVVPAKGVIRRWLNDLPKTDALDGATLHGIRIFKETDVRLS